MSAVADEREIHTALEELCVKLQVLVIHPPKEEADWLLKLTQLTLELAEQIRDLRHQERIHHPLPGWDGDLVLQTSAQAAGDIPLERP